jgi:glucosamine kinase
MVMKGLLNLGIDSGGSARIEDKYGAALGEGSSGLPTTRLGIDQTWRSTMRACAAAAEQAALAWEDLALMHGGITSLGRRGAVRKEITHPFASVRFISDELAACLGVHGGADCAIVVAGTGSVGVSLVAGRELRFGGYGFPISGEGSGAEVGLQAIRLSLCAADERGETSPLLDEILGAFDHDPVQAVAWSEQATGTGYAAFAPMVLRQATRGAPTGRRIVERAADAIGDLLDVFLRHGIDRLSLVGRLSAPIAAWLTPDLRGRLTPPNGDAVAGALLVVRRRAAVADAASERERVHKVPNQ